MPVTDPLILKALEDAPLLEPQSANPNRVTDPLILRQLQQDNPNALADPNTGQIITRAPGGTSTPGTDLLYGFRKPIDNLAVLSGRAVEGAFPALGLDTPGWATGLRVGAQEAARNARQEYERVHAGGPPDDSAMTKAGSEIIPAITAYAMPGSTSARFLPRTLSNMGSGAATTLMTGDPNAPVDQLAGQAALGAGVGAGSSMLMGGAARAFDPAMAQPGSDVRKLMDMGVRPTIGQASGGVVNRIEQGLTSLPIVGDMIKASRRRAVVDLNTGVINHVLEPLDEELPKGVQVGREALNHMADRVTDAYARSVPAAGAPLDASAEAALVQLKAKAQMLPDAQRGQFNRMIDDYVERRLDPNRHLAGDGYKAAESDLGKASRGYLYDRNSDYDQRLLGTHLGEAQSILRENLARSSPQAAADIAAANAAYSRMQVVSKAVARPGEDPGVFGPSQLQNAAYGQTFSGNAKMRGTGPFQDTADAARRVLGANVPDSGTPIRTLVTGGALGAGANSGLLSPEVLAKLIGTAGTFGSIYNPISQPLLAHLMATRHPMIGALADPTRALTPGVTVGSVGGLLGP